MKHTGNIFLLVVIVVFFFLVSCENDEEIVVKGPDVSLISPANKSNGVAIAPLFEWKASDPDQKPLQYDFYLGLDSTKLFVQARNLKQENYQLIDYKLRKNKKYYWKVVVKNSVRQKESEIWSFLSIPAPDAPVLVGPKEGSYVRDVLTFDWEIVPAGVDETISYNLFFGKTNPPTEIIATVEEPTYMLDASTLDVGTVYYWKVEASDLVNKSSSETSSFKKLQPGSPDEPVLLSPDNQSSAMSGALIDWTDVVDPEGDVVSYDVYLDKVNPPVVFEGNVATSEFTTSSLDVNSAYYWYVVAKDPAGNATQSEIFGFTVIGNGPGFPSFNNFTTPNVLSIDESLVWNATEKAISYDIYIDTINPPVNKVASDLVETTYLVKNSEIPSDIANIKTYYAIVVAKDGSGNETHSFPARFTPQMTGVITDARGPDVNDYKWVRVGTQIWMAENLRAKKLTDGTDLVIATAKADVADIDTQRYGEHPEGETGFTPNWVDTYGRVYTTALARSPLLVPEGWHLPTLDDKNLLQEYADQKPETLLGLWYPWAQDLYRLNFVPAGFTTNGGKSYRFKDEKDIAYFWVEGLKNGVWGVSGNPDGKFGFREEFSYNTVGVMISVRLIKD